MLYHAVVSGEKSARTLPTALLQKVKTFYHNFLLNEFYPTTLNNASD